VGPSKTPCDCYNWGPNDLRPKGTGQTTIVPVTTLKVEDDGTITSTIPNEIKFKDTSGWKPVCPFFELHGEWVEEGRLSSGPITPEILKKFGKSAHDLKWKVEVANLKAFHFTQIPDDKIIASVELDGDVTQRNFLRGLSPQSSQNPLIHKEKYLPLGSVQIIKPSSEFPTFRLRFTPSSGFVYGPSNLREKTDGYRLPADRLIINPEANWCKYAPLNGDQRTVPQGEYAVTNLPQNAIDGDIETYWESFGKGSYLQVDLGDIKDIHDINIAWYRGDLRQSNFEIHISTDGVAFTNVFASKSSGKTLSFERYELLPKVSTRYIKIVVNGNTENDWATITEISINQMNDGSSIQIDNTNITGSRSQEEISLGLVDDVCDGIIRCSLDGLQPAYARIVVGPPKFDPDRRHFTSLADTLSDRMKRYDVWEQGYIENIQMTSLEIRDFLERALETVGLTNIDAQNDRVRRYNRFIARDQNADEEEAANKVFPSILPVEGRPFPLTELGRQNHRRFVSLEVFENILRDRTDLIENYIRKPVSDEKYFDRKMPFAMLGSDGGPLHMTRRQYDLLVRWQKRLLQDVDEGT